MMEGSESMLGGGQEPATEPALIHARSLTQLDQVQAHLVESDGRVADLFLRFVREASSLLDDPEQLYAVLSRFTFEAFPQATHFVLILRDTATGELNPLLVRSRDGQGPSVGISRTLVNKVIEESISVLYSRDHASLATSDSIRLSRIDAAICSPLRCHGDTIGVLQLDIRRPARGSFGRKDVDRLAVFAHHVGLVLENLRLRDEQREAFESTIHALVHSLSLKDPDTALHSERVQSVSVLVGRAMGLSGHALEVLRVAAILHDMGKHGIRNEVLLKPARLSPEEREEMTRHTDLTENILCKIRYPAHLKDVPMVAAYHHEKVNGGGTYGVSGEDIPLPSRIISVADVFDALLSRRVYKGPMPLSQALAILEEGRDRDWDGVVIDALRRELDAILFEVYHMTAREADARPARDDEAAQAA